MIEVDADTENIRIAVEIACPPEEAWRFLTEEWHVRDWWGGHVSFDARHGGALREVWSDGVREVVTSGIVKRFEPPWFLALSWSDDDWPGETEVSFTLAGKDGATQLLLVHSGWGVHPPAKRRRLMDEHAQDWSGHLARLARHAAKG